MPKTETVEMSDRGGLDEELNGPRGTLLACLADKAHKQVANSSLIKDENSYIKDIADDTHHVW